MLRVVIIAWQCGVHLGAGLRDNGIGMSENSSHTGLPRRTVLAGSAGLTVAGASVLASSPVHAAPLIRRRGTLPSGIQIGDVTPQTAVLWARSDRKGRMVVRIAKKGRNHRSGTSEIVGPWATEKTDYTAKVGVKGLAPGRHHDISICFEDEDGVRSEVLKGGFSTPALHRDSTTFVWTGDTAGQGWGINPDIGGMPAYDTMLATAPDFLLHSGDNIYADNPILPEVKEEDGNIWRNVTTPEVSKVAETLKEFRGRYRYNQMAENIRRMYAQVPVIAQWDDHETTNNWYTGEILTDERYAQEKRVDVLAARARQAFGENMPIADGYLAGRSGWYDLSEPKRRPNLKAEGEPLRIYRTIHRGAQLDIFCLDMRTYKGPNPAAAQENPVAMLGKEQVEWLIKELRASKATWKVIASDMPLGLIIGDGDNAQEGVSDGRGDRVGGREHEIADVLRQIKKHKIRNTVWLTADVHYAAAHHYDPSRAVFTDFEPFYEFVAGAIHAGSFGPNKLEGTFGPKALFEKSGDYVAQSPRFGTNQFFGHVEIDRDGSFTVKLIDGTGEVLYTKVLEPQKD